MYQKNLRAAKSENPALAAQVRVDWQGLDGVMTYLENRKKGLIP